MKNLQVSKRETGRVLFQEQSRLCQRFRCLSLALAVDHLRGGSPKVLKQLQSFIPWLEHLLSPRPRLPSLFAFPGPGKRPWSQLWQRKKMCVLVIFIYLRTWIPHLSVARSRSAVSCFAICSLGLDVEKSLWIKTYLSESISARLFVPRTVLLWMRKTTSWYDYIWWLVSNSWTFWRRTWAWCGQAWAWSACSSCCCTPPPTGWTPSCNCFAKYERVHIVIYE